MTQDPVESIAQALKSAYESGQMVDAPPSARPGFDLNAAYDVEAMLKLTTEG